MLPYSLHLLLCVLAVGVGDALKIAIFAPFMSNSNILWNKRVGEELAKAGHNVTIYGIEMFDDKKVDVNIDKRISVVLVNGSIGDQEEEAQKMQAIMAFENIPLWDPRVRKMMGHLSERHKSCEKIISDESLLKSIEAEHFDLAFTHMYNFCPIGIIHLTKIPTWIWLNSGTLFDNVAHLMGVPVPPSYCAPMVMDAGDRLSFLERTKSFVGHALFNLFWRTMVADKETETFRARFGKNFPDLADLATKAPLVMVNSNELYDFARPTLAKIVNIGGLGIKTADAKPLSGEYKLRADRAKKGIVSMSFGSIAPMYLMPDTWKEAYFNAFEQLPDVEFFLRYEHPENISHLLPKNAYAAKWLPQTDLLQHPKSLGLISHGGYNSLQDAIHAGKPLIATGLFAEQPRNAHLIERLGLGINLHKDRISKESVLKAITRLIEDKTLLRAAQRLKEMVRTKPVSAETLLVRWTEFLGQHKSLDNLVPVGAGMSVFVYHSIDVILFLSFIVCAILFLIFALLKAIYRRICGKRVESVDDEKKKQVEMDELLND